MHRLILVISIILLSITQLAFSQSKASLSTPELQFNNNNVIIVYNILNSNPNETFKVSLDVTDGAGRQISARSLSGDVGNQVTGGNGKSITWDLSRDKIQVSEELYFQIIADAVNINVSAANTDQRNASQTSNETRSEPTTRSSESSSSSITKGSAIFQSIIFPGLGLTKVKSSPHWLKGIMGYGCLAGGVVMHTASTSSYASYQTETDLTQRDNYYNKSLSQRNLSNALFFGAIGVWAIDFIWTAASSGRNFRSDVIPFKKVRVEPTYYTQYQTPALTFRYTF